RRGLAGAVGAEEPDPLAALDREADAVDRLDPLVLAVDERAQGRDEPGRPLVDAEVLGELAGADHGASRGLSGGTGGSSPGFGSRAGRSSGSAAWPGGDGTGSIGGGARGPMRAALA